MSELTRQQLCAALAISEGTVRRLELAGMPCTPVGKRSKRYNLDECKAWLRSHGPTARAIPEASSRASEYLDAVRKVKLRVYPSKL